jgi:DNA polymerase-1
LAQQLGISPDEAVISSRSIEQYQGVQRYIENCLSQARDTGVTKTLFGRIRQHPEINSAQWHAARHGRADCYQFRSRHFAADIIKIAMIRFPNCGAQAADTHGAASP